MNAASEKVIVEINGVKLEVDTRHARVIHENLAVGSKVKLLDKSGYSGPTVHPGVIVGFNAFESAPTIIVAYVKLGYGDSDPLQFAYINSTDECRKKWDIVPDIDDDMPVRRDTVMQQLDRGIEKARAALAEAEAKRAYFLSHFGVYWPELATSALEEEA